MRKLKGAILEISFVASLALAPVLAMTLSPAVSAQRVPIGTLAGTVLDGNGKPVADASVTIQTSDGLHPHATHTDSNGHFEFDRWETGQYDVRAYANGEFSDWDRRIMIHSKKTTQITLRMPKASAETIVVK
ncbi:MAG: carboxypeptidase-like regulatory domain-containing protein [Candidatus Acidiferrales bacterium]